VINIRLDMKRWHTSSTIVPLDPVRACIYICAEYGATTQNARSGAKPPISSRLLPREIEFRIRAFRELEGLVASTYRDCGAHCIHTRSRDGSPERKEE
jgi:hypothetical protein